MTDFVLLKDAEKEARRQKIRSSVINLAPAQAAAGAVFMPPNYRFTDEGLTWLDPTKAEADGDAPAILITSPFDVVAETRDDDGTSWGVLLHWKDHDGRDHQYALPRAALAGDGAEARRILLDGGLYIAPSRKSRELLNSFLLQVRSPARVRATERVGWHNNAFVLPDDCFSADERDDFLLQNTSTLAPFRKSGTLESWQQNIARHAVGNSRLMLAISAAFAAPLLNLCSAESGVIHFCGPSSIAKTTHLHVAGSVWGGGGINGYLRSWRAAANGLEGVAAAHCDTLLCLDELAQVAAKEAGEVAYMLANGQGKSRGSREGLARKTTRWRILVLSSGEIGLADKVAEDGRRRSTAGQQVRVIDLPADAGAGLGMFEQLHDFATAEALARHLRDAAHQHYGLPSREFLTALISQLDEFRRRARVIIDEFREKHCPRGADGQVDRVAQRFGLIAAGGEIACACGIVPWQPGDAIQAAARCFEDWLETRGGHEAAETRFAVEQVRAFLLAHGMSRFLAFGEPANAARDLAGYREASEGGWDYYFHPAGWKEACRGLDPRRAARVLVEKSYLVRGGGEKGFSKTVRVPGQGKRRVYHISPRLLEDDAETSTSAERVP